MTLKAARQRLLDTLTTAGIDAYYGWGVFSAPCCRIFPSGPWVGMSGMAGGRRVQRYETWAITGRVDSNATFDELEDLVQRINNAIDQMPDFGHVEWQRPTAVEMSGVRYLASRGIIETLLEV